MGVVPLKDVVAEFIRFEQIRESNPEIDKDHNSPIWRPVAAFRNRTKTSLDRWGSTNWEESKDVETGVPVCRVPYLNWRLADCFLEGCEVETEHQINALRSLWNVQNVEQVYLQAFNRLGEGMGYFWNAQLAHTNIFWPLPENTTNITYARPNYHNINIDGSVGDYVESHSWPIKKASEFEIGREIVGAYSAYLSMVTIRTDEITDEKHMRFSQNFISSLPGNAANYLKRNNIVGEVREAYINRKRLTDRGLSVKSGIEYFTDHQFMQNADEIIHGLVVFTRVLRD